MEILHVGEPYEYVDSLGGVVHLQDVEVQPDHWIDDLVIEIYDPNLVVGGAYQPVGDPCTDRPFSGTNWRLNVQPSLTIDVNGDVDPADPDRMQHVRGEYLSHPLTPAGDPLISPPRRGA